MLLISFIARPWPRSPTWNVLAHRSEQILARREGFGRAAGDYRESTRRGAMCAAADRRVQHRNASSRELLAKAPRRERVDRAHAQHDVALLCGLHDAVLAEDHSFRLGGRLDHADRPVAPRRDRFGRGFGYRSGSH
jgi:hypothetical protein